MRTSLNTISNTLVRLVYIAVPVMIATGMVTALAPLNV